MCGTRRGGVGSALAGAVTGGIGEASWTCTKCTVTNTAGAARCECCDTARDSGVGNPSSAAAAASADDGGAIFNAERLSPAVWKIVEADRYGQFPFIYVIMGVDKCIVFDTGCDTGKDHVNGLYLARSNAFSKHESTIILMMMLLCP